MKMKNSSKYIKKKKNSIGSSLQRSQFHTSRTVIDSFNDKLSHIHSIIIPNSGPYVFVYAQGGEAPKWYLV